MDWFFKISHAIFKPPFWDSWSGVHMAAGAFICKVALWLGASAFWAVMWVLIIGILWEIVEYLYEGWKPYGSVKAYWINTASDLFVETGLAFWMVV